MVAVSESPAFFRKALTRIGVPEFSQPSQSWNRPQRGYPQVSIRFYKHILVLRGFSKKASWCELKGVVGTTRCSIYMFTFFRKLRSDVVFQIVIPRSLEQDCLFSSRFL